MIDKLNLTVYKVPDYEYLNIHGDLKVDEYRQHIYKDMYFLEKAVVFCRPHKFSDKTNARTPYTKIDLNPKYFESFNSMWALICLIFNSPGLTPDMFNVTRIDIAVDIKDITTVNLLSMLNVKRIRSGSFNFYKGTIYAGSNPKIRIYDKVKEIKARLKKGEGITAYENELLVSGDVYTRFEIQARPERNSLKAVLDDTEALVLYFDRLEIFNYPDNEASGIMQIIYGLINRKDRNKLDQYKDLHIVEKIKNQFLVSLNNWLKPAEEPF